MKKLYFVLLSSVIFTACSGTPASNNQEVSGQSTDANLFEKKQACSEYQDEITEKLEGQDFYVEKTGFEGFHTLEKVFYSPKEDSCLYIARESDFEYGVYTYEHLTMVDALTGEMLLSTLMVVGEVDYLERENDFYAIVSDYE